MKVLTSAPERVDPEAQGEWGQNYAQCMHAWYERPRAHGYRKLLRLGWSLDSAGPTSTLRPCIDASNEQARSTKRVVRMASCRPTLQFAEHVMAARTGQPVQLVAQRLGGANGTRVVVDVRPAKAAKAPRPPWRVRVCVCVWPVCLSSVRVCVASVSVICTCVCGQSVCHLYVCVCGHDGVALGCTGKLCVSHAGRRARMGLCMQNVLFYAAVCCHAGRVGWRREHRESTRAGKTPPPPPTHTHSTGHLPSHVYSGACLLVCARLPHVNIRSKPCGHTQKRAQTPPFPRKVARV